MEDLTIEDDMDIDDELVEFDLDTEIDGFDISHGATSTRVETAIAPIMRYPRPPARSVKCERAADLAKNTPDLQPGEAMYVIVSGNFIFGDYIEALLVEKNAFAEEIMIATLSLGSDNVDSLKNLVDGGFVGQLTLIVSDFWYAHERRKEGGVPYIMKYLGGENFTLAAAGLHTKVTLIKTRSGKHLVMHGSANLRSSRNIEQFVIENNEDLYRFNAEWMGKIAEHFSANKKSLRGEKLWQAL